ncbi:syntaxin-7-like [Corticium candelabrum]|uniref:syntaxin-7-like n=1 Tax=Corticium candelabrum TaxID=121492 RepID=UPI002E255DDE|nr:syntaxin-7-like [Corticium candelabrum]
MSRRGDFDSLNYGSTARGAPQRDKVHLDGFTSSDGEGYQLSGEANDFDSQCQELSNAIQSISRNTSQMERLVRQLGTPSDAPGLRRRLVDLRSSVKEEVSDTAQTLKRLEETARGPGRRHERLRIERLKSEYYDTTKRYRNLLKEMMAAERSPAAVLAVEAHAPRMSKKITTTYDAYDDNQGLLEANRQREVEVEQLLRQDDDIEFQQALIEEREENIKKIETEILEINEIFRDIGTLVHEQGEQIDLIEANITTTKTRVEEGNQQLKSAAKHQKSARTKMCILLIIIIIIAAIVATIVAVEVK